MMKEFVFREPIPLKVEMVRNQHRVKAFDSSFMDRPHGHPRRNLPAQFQSAASKQAAAIPDKRTAKLRTQILEERPRSPKLRPRPRSALERTRNFSSHTYNSTQSTNIAFDPRNSLASNAFEKCLESIGKSKYHSPPPMSPIPSEEEAPSSHNLEKKLSDASLVMGGKVHHTKKGGGGQGDGEERVDVDFDDDEEEEDAAPHQLPQIGNGIYKLLEAAIGHPFNDVLVPRGILGLFETMEEDLGGHEEKKKKRTTQFKSLQGGGSAQRRRPQTATTRTRSNLIAALDEAVRQNTAAASSSTGGAIGADGDVLADPTLTGKISMHASAVATAGVLKPTQRLRPQSAKDRKIRPNSALSRRTPQALDESNAVLLSKTSDPTSWADETVMGTAQTHEHGQVSRSAFVGKKIGGGRTGGGFQMNPSYLKAKRRFL